MSDQRDIKTRKRTSRILHGPTVASKPMLTKFLAKLTGLWIVLVVIGMIVTRQATLATLDAFFANPAVLWITGIFTILFGLTIVLLHNRWSGGPIPVLVTLYGWVALVKGLTFVWLPPPTQADLYRSLHFDRYFVGYAIVALVIGGYLTYGGFALRDYDDEDTGESGGIAKRVVPHRWPTVPHKPPRL